MISRAEVDKLLDVRAAGPSLLSLYMQVPLDPAGLRGLPAHAGELFALAARDGPGVPAAIRVRAADARAVLGLLASRARDWLGRTVAIFACAELGLAEAIPLPCRLQERAVLATRPHVRPLLLAIQRCPAYRVAVVNRRHAWLFSIADGQVSTAVLPPAEGMRSHGFSGWYGLQAHRANEPALPRRASVLSSCCWSLRAVLFRGMPADAAARSAAPVTAARTGSPKRWPSPI